MIQDNMRFNGFPDFYSRKDIISGLYANLKIDEKAIYKYYVYSRRYLRERTCDAIWEYINAATVEELMDAEMHLCQEYVRYR